MFRRHAETADRSKDATPARAGGRRRALVGVLAVAAAGAPLLITGAAAAHPALTTQTRTFHDAVGDTTYVDITKVSVSYGKRLTVTFNHHVPFDQWTELSMWIGLPHSARPSYFMDLYMYSEGILFNKTHLWGTPQSTPGPPAGCQGRYGIDARFTTATGPFTLSVPARCLGNPGKVRVALRTLATEGDYASVDWGGPKTNTFFNWVRRG